MFAVPILFVFLLHQQRDLVIGFIAKLFPALWKFYTARA